MSHQQITSKHKPTLRIAIQEYSHATKNYRGRKSFLVRLGSKSQIKEWLSKFEALLREME